MLCNDFSKRTGTSWTKSFGPLRELWDLLRKNVPIIGRKGIRTEAPHSAKAPSVRKKELLFFDALWRNSAWIGVLGGSQNPSVTGALEPVQKPDSFGIAVKALAKSRVRSPELSR